MFCHVASARGSILPFVLRIRCAMSGVELSHPTARRTRRRGSITRSRQVHTIIPARILLGDDVLTWHCCFQVAQRRRCTSR
eukprot:2140045-Rhodomonas_salina.1